MDSSPLLYLIELFVLVGQQVVVGQSVNLNLLNGRPVTRVASVSSTSMASHVPQGTKIAVNASVGK